MNLEKQWELFYFVEVLNEKIGIMGNKINPELEAVIEELDEAAVKELQLFVEFLLRKKIPEKETNKKGKPLENMRQIPIPLEGLIIDRAEIYDDRG